MTDWTIKAQARPYGNGIAITVVREHTAKLTAEQYAFRFVEDSPARLVLTAYDQVERPTKRHAYRPIVHFDTFDKRNSTIERADVPLTDEIKDAARKALADYIATIPVWSGQYTL